MSQIAKFIDHTLLAPTATEKEIILLCEQAKQYGFAAVCIPPYRVNLAANNLKNNPEIEICTIIGSPLGFNSTAIKAAEAKETIHQGATEIDMTINISAVKDGNWTYVTNDILQVVQISDGSIVKVIIETSYLTEAEIIKVSKLVMEAGAHFIQTSSGFAGNEPTVEKIKLIRSVVGDNLKIKVASKIRDYDTAKTLVNAGADRLEVEQSIKIIQEEAVILGK